MSFCDKFMFLSFFCFDDKDSIDLQKWMIETKDIKKWGPRVKETLGLESGCFQSYRSQTNLVDYLFDFVGGR